MGLQPLLLKNCNCPNFNYTKNWDRYCNKERANYYWPPQYFGHIAAAFMDIFIAVLTAGFDSSLLRAILFVTAFLNYIQIKRILFLYQITNPVFLSKKKCAARNKLKTLQFFCFDYRLLLRVYNWNFIGYVYVQQQKPKHGEFRIAKRVFDIPTTLYFNHFDTTNRFSAQ